MKLPQPRIRVLGNKLYIKPQDGEVDYYVHIYSKYGDDTITIQGKCDFINQIPKNSEWITTMFDRDITQKKPLGFVDFNNYGNGYRQFRCSGYSNPVISDSDVITEEGKWCRFNFNPYEGIGTAIRNYPGDYNNGGGYTNIRITDTIKMNQYQSIYTFFDKITVQKLKDREFEYYFYDDAEIEYLYDEIITKVVVTNHYNPNSYIFDGSNTTELVIDNPNNQECEIILYKYNGERIRVNKKKYLTEIVNLKGVLRQSISIINPIIRIEYYNNFQFNYAYIPTFNRYYFIDNIDIIQMGVLELNMNIDVLMTYSNLISETYGICGQNQYSYDKFLIDENVLAYPNSTTKNVLLSDGVQTNPLAFDVQSSNAIRYVISFATSASKITNTPGFSIYGNGIDYMIVSEYALTKILSSISGANLSSLTNLFRDEPGKAIIAINVFPFNMMSYKGTVPLLVDVGKYDNSYYKYVYDFIGNEIDYAIFSGTGDIEDYKRIYKFNTALSDKMINVIRNINFTKRFDRATSFLDYAPYTKCDLYLPFYGFVEFDTKFLYDGSVSVDYFVDVITNDCIIQVTSTICGLVYKLNTKCGTSIPFYYSNVNEKSLNLTKGIASLAVSLLTRKPQLTSFVGGGETKTVTKFNYGKVGRKTVLESTDTITSESPKEVEYKTDIRGVANKIGENTINALSQYTDNIVFGESSESSVEFAASYSLIPFIRITKLNTYTADNYEKYVGKPYVKYIRMGTLRGFTKMNSVYIDNFEGTTNEQMELENELKTGFIIED